jgi:hypothetical protein
MWVDKYLARQVLTELRARVDALDTLVSNARVDTEHAAVDVLVVDNFTWQLAKEDLATIVKKAVAL